MTDSSEAARDGLVSVTRTTCHPYADLNGPIQSPRATTNKAALSGESPKSASAFDRVRVDEFFPLHERVARYSER